MDMTQRTQQAGSKAENQTEDGASILYETTTIRRNNDSYRNCSSVSVRWRNNSFVVCTSFGNTLVADKRKGYNFLEGRF